MASHRLPPTLAGVLYTIILLIATFAYAVFLLGPVLPLLFTVPPIRRTCMFWYHRWSGIVAIYYFGIAAAGLELLLGVDVHTYGDALPKGERALMLCNHRTRVDWMFLWCLCVRTEQLSTLRIVLKDSLKSIPGFGWGMQMSLFIFLTRDRSKDLVHMRQLLQYTVANGYATTLLLFPEGTDLSPSNVEKSRKFAETKGIPVTQYVLQPKTAGFLETINHLAPALDAVYDVTIAYADYRDPRTGALLRPNEKSLLFGKPPREVHMHVQRIAIKDMPLGNEGALKTWLTASFQAKEKRLAAFYQGAEDGSAVAFKGTAAERTNTDEQGVKRVHLASVLFFLGVVSCISYLWMRFWLVKWYAMSMCCIFTLLGGFCDGLDVLELRLGDMFGMTPERKPHKE